ncbi:uncharacterized protein LOC130694774 isoform X1 [Daphnia carinata]|uniref:uncharacterized protein LOC130694774 isoform X1 n=1 Tax=Daphnia carinata TaxID=120202 RepID=UPI00257CF129|nr:uncharacterized protein LOC130694774 isoform X1 [Daphnia carinata]
MVFAVSRVRPSISAIFLTLMIVNFGSMVPAAPVSDRLQEMLTAIQPSFSQGLIDLSNLFDFVTEQEEPNFILHEDDNITLSIQNTIQSASNSLNETEAITNHHIQLYEVSLLSLTSDISAKEYQLRNDTNELEFLITESNKWQVEADKLQKEATELDNKARELEQKAHHTQQRMDKRVRNRWKWITATILTAGLASPGLVIGEVERGIFERDRNNARSQANERLQLLRIVQGNLKDISTRQQTTIESINKTRASLASAQTLLDQMRLQYSVLASLGVQIRNVSTFLTLLNGEMGVLHGQQQLLVLFTPLLESVDSLVTFLENNANMVVSLSEQEALTKIREYLSQNVIPRLETEKKCALREISNNDTRTEQFEHLGLSNKQFQLDQQSNSELQVKLLNESNVDLEQSQTEAENVLCQLLLLENQLQINETFGSADKL